VTRPTLSSPRALAALFTSVLAALPAAGCRSNEGGSTCLELPVEVDASLWVDFACASSVTAEGEALVSVTDRASGHTITPEGSWTFRQSASSTGLHAAETGAGSLNGPSLPAAALFDEDVTYFYVQRPAATSAPAAGPSAALQWDDEAQLVRAQLPWEDGRIHWDTPSDGAGTDAIAPAVIYGAWSVFTLTRAGAAGAIRVNGAEIARRDDLTAVIDTATPSEASIAIASGYAGTVGEALLVRGALSSADRDAIEAHLMDKWGVWPGLDGPPASFDELVSACATLGSCPVPNLASGVQLCLAAQTTRLRPYEIRCLASASSDCARARECVGHPSFAATGGVTRCEGAFEITAGEGEELARDCGNALSALGPHCVVGMSGPVCAGSVGTCTPGDFACDGSFAMVCAGSMIMFGLDCSRRGLACALEVDQARCTDGTSIACDGEITYPRCDGDALVTCEGGFEARQPCDRIVAGLGCFVSTSNGLAYCGAGDDCDPYGETSCTGGTDLEICAAGTPRTIDCGALGFAGCQIEDPDTGTQTYPYCVE
jgi:hypothetical protein